jgi:hypothetical protein
VVHHVICTSILLSACSDATPTQRAELPATVLDSPAPQITTSPTNTPPTTTPVADGLTNVTVRSDAGLYHVLWFTPDPAGSFELPVAIERGVNGDVVLTDNRRAMPDEQYRIETRSISDPGDADGDGNDDLAELDGGGFPLNPGKAVDRVDGVLSIPERAVFEELSYQGEVKDWDAYLANQEFVKFVIADADTDHPSMYFMNTETHQSHPTFTEAIGLGSERVLPGRMLGDIVFDPEATSPSGKPGLYRFAFQPNNAYSFAEVAMAYELLATHLPFIGQDLAYNPLPQAALPLYETEKALYDASRVNVVVASAS